MRRILKKYKNLIRLINLILNYKGLLFLSAFFMIIYTSIGAISPRVLMELIDTISGNSNLFSVEFLIFSIIILAILEIISTFFSDYMFSLIGKKVVTKMKMDIMNHLFTLDGDYISKLNVGDHINILDSDTSMIEQIGTRTIFNIICSVFTTIFILSMLISIQWDIAVIVLLFQIIITYLQIRFFKNMILMRRQVRNINGQITNVEQKVLGSFMNVIQLNVKKFVIDKLLDKQNQYIKSSLKFQWSCGINLMGIKTISIIILCYILISGIHRISQGLLTIGGLITIVNYSQKISTPIQNIINSNMQIQQALVSLEKIFLLLDSKGINNSSKKLILENKYELSLDKVKFSYEHNANLINYDDIIFYPNSINVVVGKSGCGKSTLIKLLYRLWDTKNGDILINKNKINDYDIDSIRLKFGIVNQNPFIFNDSIMNNLILGRENLQVEYIEEICKKVKIHDVIMNLPNGYETVLGDKDGIILSGGQLQRLEIARILISSPDIIIMDEPTSALDLELEKDIWSSLYEILRKSTTIIITHRKEVLNYADYIYVLD